MGWMTGLASVLAAVHLPAGHVTRACITQIIDILHLAPDIQSALLHLTCVESGRNPQPIVPTAD